MTEEDGSVYKYEQKRPKYFTLTCSLCVKAASSMPDKAAHLSSKELQCSYSAYNSKVTSTCESIIPAFLNVFNLNAIP